MYAQNLKNLRVMYRFVWQPLWYSVLHTVLTLSSESHLFFSFSAFSYSSPFSCYTQTRLCGRTIETLALLMLVHLTWCHNISVDNLPSSLLLTSPVISFVSFPQVLRVVLQEAGYPVQELLDKAATQPITSKLLDSTERWDEHLVDKAVTSSCLVYRLACW